MIPETMIEVRVETRASRVEEMLLSVWRTGLFHPIPREVGAKPRGLLEADSRAKHLEREVQNLLSQLSGFIGGLEEAYPGFESVNGLLEEVERRLETVRESVLGLVEELESSRARLAELRKKKRIAEEFEKARVSLEEIRGLKRFYVKAFLLPKKDYGDLKRAFDEMRIVAGFVETNDDYVGVAAVPSARSSQLDDVLRMYGVTVIEDVYLEHPEKLRGEIEGLVRRINELEENISRVVSEKRDNISILLGSLNLLRDFQRLVSATVLYEYKVRLLGVLERVAVIGFVPQREISRFEEELGGKAFVIKIGEEARAPSKVSIPASTRIFGAITYLFGFPRYKEVDPTPINAVTFPAYYGMMFADAGQGPILALAGLWARVKMGKRTWGNIMIILGISATIFGLLFGEIFGYSIKEFLPWYEPLLPMHSEHGINTDAMMLLLGVSMLIGIIHLTLGMLLKVVNLAIERHWDKVFLLQIPFITFYLSGVMLVAKLVLNLPVPLPGPVLTYALVASALTILLGEPILALLRRRGLRKAIGEAFMEFSLHILEFISNTISYTRLAIVLLVHVALMMLVAETSKAGPLVGIPAQVLGNAGVIALEGLIAFVQSLRLHLYEFMTKFYEGGGEEYMPVLLRPAVAPGLVA